MNRSDSSKMEKAWSNGMEAFRRLASGGFLVLHGHGEKYSLTASGKARFSDLVGRPLVGPAKDLPDLVSALETWLLRHSDDNSDDYALVMATASLMAENGYIRLRFGGWR